MQIRVAFFALALTTALSADFDTESLGMGLTERTDKFLSVPTGDARAQMAQFSDEDLQKITTAFKKEHSASDQRIFWLSEELYRRNAERVAAVHHRAGRAGHPVPAHQVAAQERAAPGHDPWLAGFGDRIPEGHRSPHRSRGAWR